MHCCCSALYYNILKGHKIQQPSEITRTPDINIIVTTITTSPSFFSGLAFFSSCTCYFGERQKQCKGNAREPRLACAIIKVLKIPFTSLKAFLLTTARYRSNPCLIPQNPSCSAILKMNNRWLVIVEGPEVIWYID